MWSAAAAEDLMGYYGNWAGPSSAAPAGPSETSGQNTWELPKKPTVMMNNRTKLILELNLIIVYIIFTPSTDGFGDSDQPLMLQMCLPGPLRPHRLLVFINPFGGKKKGREIFHSLVAPLFELAGISCHVIGERQQTSVRLSLCVVTCSLYVIWPFIVKWLNGPTMPEITSSRKTWQALTGKNCQNCSVTAQLTGWCFLNRKEKLLCFSSTVWCVWVGMACSVKYSTDWWGGRSKRRAFVRTIQLSLYSLVLFTSASSLPVMTAWLIWFKAVADSVRMRPVTTHILLRYCRLHGLRVFCHSGSGRPCDLSFAHYHRWGETFTLLITFNLNLSPCRPPICGPSYLPHYLTGDSQPLDVCSVHQGSALVCYSVSLLGYGFYGDVLAESEKHRWMGPLRYDYSGMYWWVIHRAERTACWMLCYVLLWCLFFYSNLSWK